MMVVGEMMMVVVVVGGGDDVVVGGLEYLSLSLSRSAVVGILLGLACMAELGLRC